MMVVVVEVAVVDVAGSDVVVDPTTVEVVEEGSPDVDANDDTVVPVFEQAPNMTTTPTPATKLRITTEPPCPSSHERQPRATRSAHSGGGMEPSVDGGLPDGHIGSDAG
ncbi:MAG: hypothetical protein WBN35_01980 [Acidimicrobiia bacterium]